MRKLLQLSMAVMLTVTLSASAFAGIMTTGKADDAPPDPAPATAPNSPPATTAPSNQQNSDAPSNPAVNVALDLLQSLLSAF